jgi:hypothetical protein
MSAIHNDIWLLILVYQVLKMSSYVESLVEKEKGGEEWWYPSCISAFSAGLCMWMSSGSVYMISLYNLFLPLSSAVVLSSNQVLMHATSFQRRQQAGAGMHQNEGGTTG